MSWPAVQLGYDAVADINGVPFGLTALSYEVQWETKERTDIDATSRLTVRVPHRKLLLSFSGKRQADVSYHAPPLALTADQEITVFLWANGRNDTTNLYTIPFLWVKSFRSEAQGATSQPQTVTITGETDGDFILPGEA